MISSAIGVIILRNNILITVSRFCNYKGCEDKQASLPKGRAILLEIRPPFPRPRRRRKTRRKTTGSLYKTDPTSARPFLVHYCSLPRLPDRNVKSASLPSHPPMIVIAMPQRGYRVAVERSFSTAPRRLSKPPNENAVHSNTDGSRPITRRVTCKVNDQNIIESQYALAWVAASHGLAD